MLKRAYGFMDASRGFYLALKETLEALGWKVSQYDQALFIYRNEAGGVEGLILSHVDDLLYGSGSSKFEKDIMKPLEAKFKFGSQEENCFSYVGLQVRQTNLGITATQDQYVETLEIPELDEVEVNEDGFANEEDKDIFHSLVGKIG